MVSTVPSSKHNQTLRKQQNAPDSHPERTSCSPAWFGRPQLQTHHCPRSLQSRHRLERLQMVRAQWGLAQLDDFQMVLLRLTARLRQMSRMAGDLWFNSWSFWFSWAATSLVPSVWHALVLFPLLFSRSSFWCDFSMVFMHVFTIQQVTHDLMV